MLIGITETSKIFLFKKLNESEKYNYVSPVLDGKIAQLIYDLTIEYREENKKIVDLIDLMNFIEKCIYLFTESKRFRLYIDNSKNNDLLKRISSIMLFNE